MSSPPSMSPLQRRQELGEDWQSTSPFVFPTCRISAKVQRLHETIQSALHETALMKEDRYVSLRWMCKCACVCVCVCV